MGTKLNPGEFDGYALALPDEPLFVLLGRDPDAPTAVRVWAKQRLYQITRGSKPESDKPMLEQALECAKAMEVWRANNVGRWRNRAFVQGHFRTTPEIRATLKAWAERNTADAHARLVGLLLADFEKVTI